MLFVIIVSFQTAEQIPSGALTFDIMHDKVRRQPPPSPKTGHFSFAESDLWLDTFDGFTDTDKENGQHWTIMAKVFFRNGFNRTTTQLSNHVNE